MGLHPLTLQQGPVSRAGLYLNMASQKLCKENTLAEAQLESHKLKQVLLILLKVCSTPVMKLTAINFMLGKVNMVLVHSCYRYLWVGLQGPECIGPSPNLHLFLFKELQFKFRCLNKAMAKPTKQNQTKKPKKPPPPKNFNPSKTPNCLKFHLKINSFNVPVFISAEKQ